MMVNNALDAFTKSAAVLLGVWELEIREPRGTHILN